VVLGEVVAERLFSVSVSGSKVRSLLNYQQCLYSANDPSLLSIYAFELFKSGAPGWKQREVAG